MSVAVNNGSPTAHSATALIWRIVIESFDRAVLHFPTAFDVALDPLKGASRGVERSVSLN
jgi:hypothetical protein